MAVLTALLVGPAASRLPGAPREGGEPASPPPPQVERAETEAQARRTAERIRRLQQEADELAVRERTLLVELRRLEVERQLKSEELARIDRDLRAMARELDATAARARALEDRVSEQRPAVQARLVALYKLRQPGYARMLLAVRDARAFGRTYRLVAALAARDRQILEDHRRTLAALLEAKTALEARRDEALTLQDEARRTRAALDRAIAAQTDLVRAIDAQRDLNAQLLGELQAAYNQLLATLAGLAPSPGRGAEAPSPGGEPRPSSAPPPSGPGLVPAQRGQLEWPVPGRVLTPFGRARQTRSGAVIVRNGIEIAAPEGTAVRAVAAGQVAFAGAFTGFGNLVILDHGRQSYSLYGYLEDLDVARGERLAPGARLGTVGRTVTGSPALYFELRIDGQAVDPLQWLRKTASR